MFFPHEEDMILNSIQAVGFDVGLRNLGMAIVRRHIGVTGPQRFECVRLQLIDLNSRVTNEAIETLHEKLNNIWPLLNECGSVNIEQQPEAQHLSGGARSRFPIAAARKRDNTQMKSISHALQAWFLSRMKPVVFVSPKSKLEVYDGPPIDLQSKSKDEYYLRKKMGIAHAKAMLNGDQHWLTYLNQLDKKDDVCDAFLQCCYELDRQAEKIEKAMNAVSQMVIL
jgi:hypothetical protein